MKVNELRIGNLVCGQTQFGELAAKIGQISEVLCAVEPLDSKIANGEWFACKLDEGEFQLIEPIPLTKEFFEKNGFILQEDLDYYGNYFTSEDMRIDVYESSRGWVVHIDNIEFSTAFCKCLKYVHELQNAYYVSTGEEMEIKL
jgi:hypothetical protein